MEVHDLYQAIVAAYDDRDPFEKCPIIEMCFALISDLNLDNLVNLCDFLKNDLSLKKWNSLQLDIQKVKDTQCYSFVKKIEPMYCVTTKKGTTSIVGTETHHATDFSQYKKMDINRDKLMHMIDKVTNMRKYLSVDNIERSGETLFPLWKSSNVYLTWDSYFTNSSNHIERMLYEKITTEKIEKQKLYQLCVNSSAINDFELFIIASYYGFIHKKDYIDVLNKTGLNNYLPSKWKPQKVLLFYSNVLRIICPKN